MKALGEPAHTEVNNVPCCGKLRRLAIDIARLVAAGKPYRSKSAIDVIFTEVCQPCEHYKPKTETTGSCDLCGCALKKEGKTFNKIAWATAHCPEKKW